jgi:hypothetical protein
MAEKTDIHQRFVLLGVLPKALGKPPEFLK